MKSYRREVDRDHNLQTVRKAQLGDLSVRLATHPGFPEWDEVGQPLQLIAENSDIHAGDRVLICPCGHGALGVWAASRTAPSNVLLLDTNAVAVDVAQRTLSVNQCEDARAKVALPSPIEGPFDVALMTLPKGRDFARLLFLHIYHALREGGTLYLAGPNRGGIKSAITDCATLYGPGVVLGYKGGCRVAQFRRGSTLPDLPEKYRIPGLANGTYKEFETEINGEKYVLRTRPGVFSWQGVDAGTRILLEALEVRTSDTVLDVGCGYGLIGLYAAQQATNGQVILVDVDLLACECARENLAVQGIENAEVVLGDGLSAVAGHQFSLIVSNPPFHSGHDVNLQVAEGFIQDAYAALKPRGRLVLVANRFLPYPQMMTERFGSVRMLASTNQYRVLYAEKSPRRERRMNKEQFF